jgi:(p)ppGpp synthase/HD superfamily hydrolase
MNINIWPYVGLSRPLVKKKRKGNGNMFRHQFETFAILLEYGYEDQVLLKAALIHDLFEDGQKVGFSRFESVITIDEDGQEVYDLVKELSLHIENDCEESKDKFLVRIMQEGTQRARVLKLADRLSNINSLPAVYDGQFVKRYIEETKLYILPYARRIDINIAAELEQSLMRYEV